jgi:hypothetical protein
MSLHRHTGTHTLPKGTHTLSKSKEKDFSYAIQDGLDQVKNAIEMVHAVNGETEEWLQLLMNCLDQSKASLVLFYMCIISQQHIQVDIILKELEEDVWDGFASLQSKIDSHKDEIDSARQEWQRKFSSSDLY